MGLLMLMKKKKSRTHAMDNEVVAIADATTEDKVVFIAPAVDAEKRNYPPSPQLSWRKRRDHSQRNSRSGTIMVLREADTLFPVGKADALVRQQKHGGDVVENTKKDDSNNIN